MNAKEIFDTVARHLFTQGRRAYDEARGMCMYRAPDGARCAAGCLIPDDEYGDWVEGKVFSSLFHAEHSVGKTIKGLRPYAGMIRLLQRVHDDSDNWRDTKAMRKALAGVAVDYALDPSTLSDLSFPSK